jgi:hypothetical protein
MFRWASFHYTKMSLYTHVKRFPECCPPGITFPFHEHFRFLLRTASPPVGIQILMKLYRSWDKG